mgnify:CR=1 FL=1
MEVRRYGGTEVWRYGGMEVLRKVTNIHSREECLDALGSISTWLSIGSPVYRRTKG